MEDPPIHGRNDIFQYFILYLLLAPEQSWNLRWNLMEPKYEGLDDDVPFALP